MSLLQWFGLGSNTSPPTDNWWYGSAGQQTAAGVRVDPDVAMTYSACWAATMLLSSLGGMVPLKLNRKLPGGGSDPFTDDPRYWLMYDSPNDDMTSMMFRASRIAQQVNRGNAFAEIERNRASQPIKLHPIHASRIPQKNIVRENGTLTYYVNNDNGTKTPIPAADMLHVPSPISEDGICGIGVVSQARLSIGFGIATETQGAAYMGNSARPAIVVKQATKAFAAKEDREDFRRQWEEVHGGPANSGKPAILPVGADVTALSFSAEDSQFLQTRQHNVEEIARWYSVPPHLIGHLLRATFNNIEHMSLEFVKYSLMKWLVLWEQELNRKLLTREERRTLFFRHVVDSLERGDLQTRTAALQQQFFNGKLTLNEWRALDDQNGIGDLGDLHFVQSAMVPLEVAAEGPQEPAAPAMPPPKLEPEPSPEVESLKAALGESLTSIDTLRAGLAASLATQKAMAAAMLREAWGRLLSVEINGVKRVAEKPEKFAERLSEFYGKHRETMTRALAGPMEAYRATGGEVGEGLVEGHVTDSLSRLEEMRQADGTPTSVFDKCVSLWHEERGLAL